VRIVHGAERHTTATLLAFDCLAVQGSGSLPDTKDCIQLSFFLCHFQRAPMLVMRVRRRDRIECGNRVRTIPALDARSRPWNRLAAVVHKNTCSAIDCCRTTRLIGHLLFQCIDQVVGCTFLVTVQKKKKSTATPGAVPCARARSHPRDPFVRPTTL
jgi:hypothetical protein